MTTISIPVEAEFAVAEETRTLTGMLLPFNKVSRPAADPITGKVARYLFTAGTVTLPDDPSDVILNYGHDKQSLTAQVGVGVEFTATPDGVLGKFRIARTPEGDRILTLAEDRILKNFSAEVTGHFTTGRDGVQQAKATNLGGAAVVRVPAFEGAHITSVAASAAETEGTTMPETETTAPETAVSLSAEDVRTIFSEELARHADVSIPVTPAGLPTGAAQFQVVEEPMYRFAGSIPGKHDFSADVIAAVNGDGEANARVFDFMGENALAPQFMDTGDTAAVNPARYRPDMFLDEGPAQPTPLYSFFYKGGLSDVTPFFYSKLDSYSGLLADHVEGTEPTAGTFATESGATVTPAPISGKIHITREVSDQGGNPQVSGLVWSKFQRVFQQMLEAKTAAQLAAGAASYATFGPAITAGADGKAVGAALESGVVDLQFLADGARFRKAFGHVDLYKSLIGAVDDMGRKLYPVINPTNANGQAASLFGHVNVAGLNIDPTWSLGATATTASNSYVADPIAIHVWNSGLTKLDKLGEDVEGYDIGAWAYIATHLYDASGIRKIAYDPTA